MQSKSCAFTTALRPPLFRFKCRLILSRVARFPASVIFCRFFSLASVVLCRSCTFLLLCAVLFVLLHFHNALLTLLFCTIWKRSFLRLSTDYSLKFHVHVLNPLCI